MGLDMWLNTKVYVGAHWEHKKVTGSIDISQDDKKLNLPVKNMESITYRAITWRKANQIHKWFVDHVQDGTDDCKPYYVSVYELQTLLALCEKVVRVLDSIKVIDSTGNTTFILDDLNEDDLSILSELEPKAGFFFGSTCIDYWYYQDIQDTITELSKLNLDPQNCDVEYVYQSSW